MRKSKIDIGIYFICIVIRPYPSEGGRLLVLWVVVYHHARRRCKSQSRRRDSRGGRSELLAHVVNGLV